MSELTHVDLTWLKKRIENWIRFGRIAEEHVIDLERRVVSFAPGSVFAFVRWASNDYGTVVSSGCRAGALAAYPQSSVGRRTTAALHA